jgi:hypothetical protein
MGAARTSGFGGTVKVAQDP